MAHIRRQSQTMVKQDCRFNVTGVCTIVVPSSYVQQSAALSGDRGLRSQ